MALKLNKNALTKSLAKRHKMVTALERALTNEPQDFEFKYESKQGDDAWHPSGDCTPPVSELYDYAQSRLDGTFEPRDWGSLQKAFLVGHFWHQLLQHVVLNDLGWCEAEAIERRGIKGWVDSSQTAGQPFHWVTGSGDIAPCHIPKHGDYIVDFKTMGSHDFKVNGLPNWCAHKYEAQINIYMDLFDVDKGLIVAIQKDSPHSMREIEFARNQELIDTIYHKWQHVSACLDGDEKIDPLDDELFKLPFTGPIG